MDLTWLLLTVIWRCWPSCCSAVLPEHDREIEVQHGLSFTLPLVCMWYHECITQKKPQSNEFHSNYFSHMANSIEKWNQAGQPILKMKKRPAGMIRVSANADRLLERGPTQYPVSWRRSSWVVGAEVGRCKVSVWPPELRALKPTEEAQVTLHGPVRTSRGTVGLIKIQEV